MRLTCLLVLVAILSSAASAQDTQDPWTPTVLIGTAQGSPIPDVQDDSVESFTASFGVSGEGSTASMTDGNVKWAGGITQMNLTVVWKGTSSPRAQAFGSTSACEDINSLTQTTWRSDPTSTQLRTDLQYGTEGVTGITVPGIAGVGEIKCAGIILGRQPEVVVALGPVVPVAPELPESFHSSIDVTIVNKGYSFSLHETYDHIDNVVRSDMFSETRGHFRVIQDYDDQSVIFIVPPNSTHPDGECIEHAMDSKDPFIRRDGTHLAATNKFLGFATKDRSPTFTPSDPTAADSSVRGVPVDVWTYKFPGNSTEYDVHFSFAVPQWKTGRSSTSHRQLRRIHLTGKGPGKEIEHIYDYIDFQPSVPDWISFNPCIILPSGKGCRCIEFRDSNRSVIDVMGNCTHRGRGGLVMVGVLIGAAIVSGLWLLLFWCCASVSLCNMWRRSKGTDAKDIVIAPASLDQGAAYQDDNFEAIDVNDQ